MSEGADPIPSLPVSVRRSAARGRPLAVSFDSTGSGSSSRTSMGVLRIEELLCFVA